jgi:uncharacterized membrane protein SirB2
MRTMEITQFLQGHYLQIKLAHLGLVACSGGLFAVRGLAVLSRASWPLGGAARRASELIDSLLLLAGASLWAALSLNPLRDHWLGVKLGLLVVYIVLGSFALRYGRTAVQRGLCYVAALAVFGFMVTVARAHHPLGLFRGLIG